MVINMFRFNDFRAWDLYDKCMIDDFTNHAAFAGWDLFENIWYDNRYIPMPHINMRDINDKKIYVGDILRCESVTGTPLYQSHLVYGILKYSAPYFVVDSCYLWHELDNIEVVGNMFENPELCED